MITGTTKACISIAASGKIGIEAKVDASFTFELGTTEIKAEGKIAFGANSTTTLTAEKCAFSDGSVLLTIGAVELFGNWSVTVNDEIARYLGLKLGLEYQQGFTILFLVESKSPTPRSRPQ